MDLPEPKPLTGRERRLLRKLHRARRAALATEGQPEEVRAKAFAKVQAAAVRARQPPWP